MSFIIHLTKEESDHLVSLSNHITYSPDKDPERFCKQSKHCSLAIPNHIQQTLRQFAKEGSPDTGTLLVKGLSLEEYKVAPTPNHPNLSVGEDTILAKIQSMFIHTIAEMISYEAEGGGRLFQDIVPIKKMDKCQTSHSSSIELEIHTEQAFSKIRPDLLSLACLRSDPNAFTYILPVKTLLENLDKDEQTLLQKPLWYTGVDLSFKLNGHAFIEGDIRGPFSILHGSKEDPHFVFDQDLMKGSTETSGKMIDRIGRLYYKHRIQYCMEPGDILIIDNHRAVHGRSPFSPRYDGTDRFLIRCFGKFDYEKTEYARPNKGRMVAAIYS